MIAAPVKHIGQKIQGFCKDTEVMELEKGANANDGGGDMINMIMFLMFSKNLLLLPWLSAQIC